MTQEILLKQLFRGVKTELRLVHLVGIPFCDIELDKDEYSVGDVIDGKLLIKYLLPSFEISSILLAADGKITSNVHIKGRKWIDMASNLHLFTYVLRSKNVWNILSPSNNSIQTYSFSIVLPTTNLPSSFHSDASNKHGSIIYSIQALLNYNGVYFCIGQKIFTLLPYLNISRLKSIDQLSKQTWQSKDGVFIKDSTKFNKIKINTEKTDNGNGSITFIKYENAGAPTSALLSFKKGPRLKLALQLPNGFTYLIGEEIPFRVELKNPNADLISLICVVLSVRIIYTAVKSFIENKELHRVVNNIGSRSRSMDWSDKLQIPSEHRITSSITSSNSATTNQPIIFQYVIQAIVERTDKETLIGETLIGVGTTRDKCLVKPRKAIIDLDLCKYPIGWTNLSFPENWDELIKTGRFGYFENPNMEFGNELNPKKMNKVRSVLSLGSSTGDELSSLSALSLSDGGSKLSINSRRSSTSTNPPSYSGLSSRRSSSSTLPPAYHQVVPEDKEI